VGQTSAAWLREVGVQSVHDLESLGPVAAFRLVQKKRPEVSLNLLWAIVAGLSDRDWRDLSDEEKEALRRDMADEHR
jgi:DNA transformation protein